METKKPTKKLKVTKARVSIGDVAGGATTISRSTQGQSGSMHSRGDSRNSVNQTIQCPPPYQSGGHTEAACPPPYTAAGCPPNYYTNHSR